MVSFGQISAATGNYAAMNPFRFSSEVFDTETDLVYYNYRYYSPGLGRWLSRAPIKENGGINLYTFVNNCSIDMTDHIGLAWWN